MSAIEHILKMPTCWFLYVYIIEIIRDLIKKILFDFINRNVLKICYTKSILNMKNKILREKISRKKNFNQILF